MRHARFKTMTYAFWSGLPNTNRDSRPNNSFERTHPRALASLGRCGVRLNSGVGRHNGMRTIIAICLLAIGFFASCERSIPQAGQKAEQALLIYLKLSDATFGDQNERESLYRFEDEISQMFYDSSIGEYDGNEVGDGYFTIYIYGPDADRIASSVIPKLKETEVLPGSYLLKRYGTPGAKEIKVPL
jgi:hypothetical protein